MNPTIQQEQVQQVSNEEPVAIRMDKGTHMVYDMTDPSKCCFKLTGVASCACLSVGAMAGTCTGCTAWLCPSTGASFLWAMFAAGFGGAAVCGGCGLLTCYCAHKHGQSFCTRCGCHNYAQEFQ